MFSPFTLFLVIFTYLVILFWLAYYAEEREKKGRSIVSNPYVYSLSLAVYCTSWTFYGSVGKAAQEGLKFLTIYIGPTLIAILWWIILRKMVFIAKEHGITNISDFIATRYGRSLSLSALVTVVAVVGITPYLGLQLKAIMTTFSILTGRPQGSHFAGWIITIMLGVFAIIFGARRLDASERHGGLIFAIAFESAIKLFAFLIAGAFVTFVFFDGFDDILERLSSTPYSYLTKMGKDSRVSYFEWTSLTFLSMMAVMLLPRQFHVAVVENSSAKHIKKAMWLFPLYLLVINLFVLPIAFGGIVLKGDPSGADYFVLTLPLEQGYPYLALLVFIGGFSAATAMVIVESLALSTMVMNSLVMPQLLRFKHVRGFHHLILTIKRLVIIGLVFLGYVFAVSIGEFYSLVDIGLKSFEAVTIFAPATFIGMYWKGANRKGAFAGILAGFIIWLYTLMIPALTRAGIIQIDGLLGKVFHSDLLNPTGLFGLDGLDRWSHSLFWGLFFNLLFLIGISLFTKQNEEEAREAFLYVDSFVPSQAPGFAFMSLKEIEDLLTQYIGPEEASVVVERFLNTKGYSRESIDSEGLEMLRQEAMRTLSGVVGPTLSDLIFKEVISLRPEQKERFSSSLKEISRSLRLSRQELARAYQELAKLKEFSENIIESIPLGVATLDEKMRVTYWNRKMQEIIGVESSEVLHTDASVLFNCLEPPIFGSEIREGEFTCRRGANPPMILKGYLNRLKGAQRGYVLVFEDVTEKKRIEEELFIATKHASVGRLAAGVSHEIGNPLASISSLVQELLEEDVSPFVRDSLLTINRHIERIARIVKSLGEFARLYPRQKIPTNLRDILNNTINLVRYDKQFRKIEIHTDIDGDPRIKIDPDQIQQVFLNLMLNARDAMPEGGKINIIIKEKNGFVEMVFSDTGHGMEEDIKDKVFDPFFTTKGPFRGTGLGLSICYSIIKDHGGSITIDSEKNRGTTFHIRIPVVGE